MDAKGGREGSESEVVLAATESVFIGFKYKYSTASKKLIYNGKLLNKFPVNSICAAASVRTVPRSVKVVTGACDYYQVPERKNEGAKIIAKFLMFIFVLAWWEGAASYKTSESLEPQTWERDVYLSEESNEGTDDIPVWYWQLCHKLLQFMGGHLWVGYTAGTELQ